MGYTYSYDSGSDRKAVHLILDSAISANKRLLYSGNRISSIAVDSKNLILYLSDVTNDKIIQVSYADLVY